MLTGRYIDMDKTTIFEKTLYEAVQEYGMEVFNKKDS